MSFRIEEKLLINKFHLPEFKDLLFKQKAKIVYPSREVNSLYFENHKKQMYNDSIEGLIPRKKIRIRNYPGTNNQFKYLEVKISSVEGRFKTSKKIDNNKFLEIKKIGYLDSQYGLCQPFLSVSYKREYYEMRDFRISIDENINYSLFTGRNLGKDENSIIEIKANFNKDRDDLLNQFSLKTTRFSKYCNGFEKI